MKKQLFKYILFIMAVFTIFSIKIEALDCQYIVSCDKNGSSRKVCEKMTAYYDSKNETYILYSKIKNEFKGISTNDFIKLYFDSMRIYSYFEFNNSIPTFYDKDILTENVLKLSKNECPEFLVANRTHHLMKTNWLADDDVPDFLYFGGKNYSEWTTLSDAITDNLEIMEAEISLFGDWYQYIVLNDDTYTTHYLFDTKKLNTINDTLKKNYEAIGDAVNDYRKTYNINTSWQPNENGGSKYSAPAISCPNLFEKDKLSDRKKYSNDQLLKYSEDLIALGEKTNKITNAYKTAQDYYANQDNYQAWSVMVSDPGVKDYSIETLKMLYVAKGEKIVYKNVPTPFQFYFNLWMNYDYAKYNDVIKILSNGSEVFSSRYDMANNQGTKNAIDSENIDVTEFLNNCNGEYLNALKDEVQARLKDGKISEEDANKILGNVNDGYNQLASIISEVSSVYGNQMNFYQDFGIVNCESIFTQDFMDWLNWAFSITQIIAVILVIIFSFVEFMKAIASSDADALKKSGQKFIKRLIALGILFLLPILINFILKVSGIEGIDEENPICIKR